MYTLQHYNVSSYFTPGAQGTLREKAATWCRASLEHSRHSPSPKQKVINGSPRGLEQDFQGCKCSWLHGRKPGGRVSRKERSLSFWWHKWWNKSFAILILWWQVATVFLMKNNSSFLLLEFQTCLFQPTLLLSSYTEEWRHYQCL